MHFQKSSLAEQLMGATNFEWMSLQQLLSEFSSQAQSTLCCIDLFQDKGIIRVRQQQVLELNVTLSDDDWQLCFALQEGFRSVGSEIPHWLVELTEGVFSRSTCLVAEPIHEESGLTIGLLYAFFTTGTPDAVVGAYQKSIAAQCSSIIHRWQCDTRHQEKLNRLWSSVELSCPGFLILDAKMRVLEKGSIYTKSVPQLRVGDRFEQHFIWNGVAVSDDWRPKFGAKQKLKFYHSLELNQRYKCSIQQLQDDMFLVLSAPVINANHAMVDYHLTANDFPSHDYITDFVFLQTTTIQNLDELQRANEVMQFRMKELERIQAELLRTKMSLENKLAERNERVIRLSNFPEQNPNPVFEIDFIRKFICFSNQAAKLAFGEMLTLPYLDLLSMLSVSHELVAGSLKLRVEFESLDHFYTAEAFRVPNEDSVRFYAQDCTELRQIKNLLARQQQGLNQLLGVLEAFNIDRDEAMHSANLGDVVQQVTKLLSVKRSQ